MQNQEFSDGTGLEEYDYGKRFQDPQIGRWWVLDPKSDLLEMSSPYVYCYNNPISYTDPDGELAILINGRVAAESERANASYWNEGILNAIEHSGIPFSGDKTKFFYVDGDRWGRYEDGQFDMHMGTYLSGNEPSDRRLAGSEAANQDWETILGKLKKDPKTDKIIEKIQIYTHSRGAAFGAGYIDALLQKINENADLFENPNNEIDLVYNMAPNQSGGDATKQADGLNSYSQHHDYDPLSGSDMEGTKANFTSDEGGSFLGHHSTSSFIKDITAFTKAFAESNGDSKKLVADFVKRMQTDYGIKVTVQQ